MTEAVARKPRRTRSVSESLLSIVLGLEAILVFFVMIAAFGLKVTVPEVAFAGGIGLIAVLLVAAALLRFPWGVWVGWVLQAVLVATGILLPIMYVIGAGFVAIWVYCFVKGRQIDSRNASALSETSAQPKDTP
ncbi:MAG: DUF4233 domain-containing protein [Rhodoglobus sp.]